MSAPPRSLVLWVVVLAASLVEGAWVPRARLAAQAGVPGGDPAAGDRIRAEFDAHVLANADTVLRTWSRAWRDDEPQDLAELYARNAVLVLPDGRPVVGRDMILELFRQGLPRMGEVQAARRDFTGSQRMVYLGGSARFEVGGIASARTASHGSHATVVLRTDSGWRIRAQLLQLDPGAESLPLTAPGRTLMTPFRPDAITLEEGPAAGYYRRTYAAVSRAVGDLAVALQEGNLRRAAELYAAAARLRSPLDGDVREGASAIAGHLPELVSSGGQVHMALLDFDASGRMAMAYGRYLVQRARGAGGMDLTGPYLLIFRLGGDEPRVRAHVMDRDGEPRRDGAGR